MKGKSLLTILVAALVAAPVFAQQPKDPAEIDPADYQVTKRELKKARKILYTPLDQPLVFPNPSPGAQWFPEAGLGLFMHWGIHSLLGAQPSWNMIKGYEWAGEWHSREEYYGQAFLFDPQDYNPDRSLTLLRTGEAVPYIYRDGFLVFQLAADRRTATDDVVKIVF